MTDPDRCSYDPPSNDCPEYPEPEAYDLERDRDAMEESDCLHYLSTLTDFRVLTRLITAAKKQQQVITEQAQKAVNDEAWTRYRRFKPGITVWCCAEGTFLGGGLQRGTKVTVSAIQPRARRLWVKVGGLEYRLTETTAARYQFRTVAPKVTSEQKTMQAIANRLNGVDG